MRAVDQVVGGLGLLSQPRGLIGRVVEDNVTNGGNFSSILKIK